MADVWVVTRYDGEDTVVEGVWATREGAVSHVEGVAPTYRRLESHDPDWACWVHPEHEWDDWQVRRLEVRDG